MHRSQWKTSATVLLGVALMLSGCTCGGPGSSCQSKADCGGTLACLAIQTCATACSDDSTCSSTEKCSSSDGCVAKDGCGANADCPTGQVCNAAAVCAQSCQANASSCGATAVCLSTNTCAPRCNTAANCGANQKCSKEGGCIAENGCGSKDDCAAGQVCDALGKCTSDCRISGCSSGGACRSDGTCAAAAADAGPASCGGQLFQASKVSSNMFIAFDKSGSMRELINNVSKWDLGTDAIKAVTQQYQSQIRFGLQLFPKADGRTDGCIPASVAVTVGDDRAAPIAAALDATGPGGSTPIGGALNAAGNVPELSDATRANYVMLVTDGAEMCGGDGEQAARNNLMQKGIKTFVVGFGAGVDADNLEQIAIAGGTPRPGNTKYYQADDAQGLQAAFNLIAQGALGCEYKLASAPPDPSKIFVYVNGVLQNRDPTLANGWDYSEQTVRVTFYGSLCNLVATDPTAKVSLVYGCADGSLTEGDRRDGGAGLPNGSACVSNADCLNGLCSMGFCGRGVGSACTSGADCSSQVCIAGKCDPGIN
jgi:hypothetical protein